AVQGPGRVRTSTQFEKDWGKVEAADRVARSGAFRRELLQGRAQEHPQPLIGRSDSWRGLRLPREVADTGSIRGGGHQGCTRATLPNMAIAPEDVEQHCHSA